MREPDTLVSTVKDLKDQINQIKSSRQFMGRDSILTYKTSSSASYDISGSPGIGDTDDFRLTLTYDKATDGAILELNMFYRVDNSDVMAAPLVRIPSDNPGQKLTWEIETLGDTYTSWLVSIVNTLPIGSPETHTAYAKYFIDGTDTGTVNIEAI